MGQAHARGGVCPLCRYAALRKEGKRSTRRRGEGEGRIEEEKEEDEEKKGGRAGGGTGRTGRGGGGYHPFAEQNIRKSLGVVLCIYFF